MLPIRMPLNLSSNVSLNHRCCYLDYSQPFELRTDAIFDWLGAVLCQRQDDLTRVVAYASRGLKRSELNYSSNKLEPFD